MGERKRSLPELFESSNGRRVKTVEDWRIFRRPEIIELYREYVYGREPVGRPDSLRFNVVMETPVMQGTAVHKQVDINFTGRGGEGRIRVQLYIPITESRVPAFIYAAIKGQRVSEVVLEECSAYWPVEDIVSRGYAAVSYHVEDLDPDFFDEGYRNGVHGVFDSPSESRSPDAWGAMSAWAWGASRVMDYLETDYRIDSERVAIVGYSRSGKACLWAGALDERFALVVSNDSGCSGAAISRGKAGERLININRGNPHWFNDNYKKFNEREDELPIDQHLLLSLVAPRHLYVASASEDNWADPESEFLGLLLAQPIYTLYGFNALDAHQMPLVNSPVCSERVGYHLREGKHDITRYDWKCFMDFADRKL
ncbi:acetylxylan esterase [Paenibacillus sp. CGMCC 1.16610]|uniref:Acetylxylan esterase n=1 Tax=Paenibacillus anseongense TaxID=2682845 RepID=A0ABW9UC00_9BACL|nr:MULTISPECIES: acetylxylan esterase [Paenibacillus]MBA2937473.1 acetylxylan esterase [Paenibacillus sp. CGMCC 1.16610]MVQ36531.1 acetylxylan esterase [Paenibacillus anseongense]